MRLGLVIDLDTCVGCHACAVACKQWNTSGTTGPLSDYDPYGTEPGGVWFNRIRHYEVDEYPQNKTINAPLSCMHCEDAACVTVCPTGASYKRIEDGIVLVDQSKCMGCNLCAWACPYGARELDRTDGVMKKCTLCVDRIYDQELPEAERQPACVLTCPANARYFGDFDDPDSEVSRQVRERGGYPLMPELGYNPTNQYLPPREKPEVETAETQPEQDKKGYLRQWLNRQKSEFKKLGERLMHPALSVIFFSVTAGAGYGALVLLVFSRYLLLVPSLGPDQVVVAGLVGLVLVTIGLLSSTLHLANPKNAWRSFTRFKTSWLSREAVFAVLFYPVCIAWLLSEWFSGWTTITVVLGLLSALIAVIVMFCTPMIYAQLKTIRQWNTPLVPANFMLLGFTLGGLVLLVVFAQQALDVSGFLHGIQILLVVGVAMKVAYYVSIGRPAGPSINSALGFTQATVRLLDVGHSSGTFLTDEFGFQVARAKLLWMRVITLICGFVLPLLLIAGILGEPGTILASLALLIAAVGVLAERWLFFAEARHVVTLYHGAQAT